MSQEETARTIFCLGAPFGGSTTLYDGALCTPRKTFSARAMPCDETSVSARGGSVRQRAAARTSTHSMSYRLAGMSIL